MKNDEPPVSAETRRPGFAWALWLAFFLLVVYPLSPGPAVTLFGKGLLPIEAMQVYRPLEILVNTSPSVARFYRWYLKDIWRFSAYEGK
jgi:hypothetical protein